MPATVSADLKGKKASTRSPLTSAKPASSTTSKTSLGKRKAQPVSKKAVVVEKPPASEDTGDEEEPEEDSVIEEKKVKKAKAKGKEKEVKEVKEKKEVKVTTAEEKAKTPPAPKEVKEKKPETKKAEKKVEETSRPKSKSKAKAKKDATPPPEESEDDEKEKGEEDGEGDDEVLLHGFSSESEDSSDEDDAVDDAPVDIGKLPTVAKDDASVKRKLEKAKKQASEDRGVIYLGRIPHGFYEDQMRGYFAQFGDVTRVRLSRNKKTGRSKHYAFVEFASSAVAEIVAETMDNYLLMGHILRCKIIPKEEVHPELWVGANRKFRRVPTARIERRNQNKPRTAEEQEKAEKRLLKRQEEKKRKLEAAGIDYDFGKVAYSKKAKQNA